LRRTCPPLRHGSFDVLHADEAVLAVRRMHEGKAVLAVLNMSDQTCPWPEGLPPHAAVLVAENGAAPGAPAYAALIVEEPA
jgi:alpha-glucosidase